MHGFIVSLVDIVRFMNKTLESVLVYDHLKDGEDPLYDMSGDDDVCYLGLAGELATDLKCSRILLPMLNRKTYNLENKLQEALKEAISLRPQRHVKNFTHAWLDFATHDREGLESCFWFANEETHNKLKEQVSYNNGKYNSLHYEADRCGLILDLPPKVIAIIPESDYFGVLSINDKFFNFLFKQNKIQVYFLRNLMIGHVEPLDA